MKTELAKLTNDPKGRFTGLPLHVEYVDGIKWMLDAASSYKTKTLGTSTVKRGFVFDFASVPRAFWWLYPPAGLSGNPYGVAALFHDWLCAHRKIGNKEITFSQANSVFLEIMLYLDVRVTMAYTMYYAVQSPWGWWLWKKRKPEDMIP
jgi:hypothetical protein